MPLRSRAQISTEYLILVSFITVLVVSALGVALYYSATIRDRLAFSNLNRFASTIVAQSEDVFYAGEPSKVTIKPYLPAGVRNITIGTNYILVSIQTGSGINTISFFSNVPLSGNLSSSEGVKRIQLIAQPDKVLILEG